MQIYTDKDKQNLFTNYDKNEYGWAILKDGAYYAHKGSEVRACKGSVVWAYEGSEVRAYEGSNVSACKGSNVCAYKGSNVSAEKGSVELIKNNMQKIKFCFTSEKAKELYNGKPPQYETPFASGFDLRAVEFDTSLLSVKDISKSNESDFLHYTHKDDYKIVCGIKKDNTLLHLVQNQRVLVKTGIRISMPIMENEIMHLEICSRSGLSLKNGVFVLNAPGIVDNDYRGELGVILYNAGHEPYEIKIGDRIAQGIFNSLKQVDFQEISQEEFEATCCDTKRGSGGFGSTGK